MFDKISSYFGLLHGQDTASPSVSPNAPIDTQRTAS